MPVLEGMAYEKPVLCSNVTSLPEVAGDAAVYFDPLDAGQIAGALGRLEDDPAGMAALAERGRTRAASFGTGRHLAARYLAVFDAVLAERVG
jgi:glycosyltransferase involved in cell wall biosynthesis